MRLIKMFGLAALAAVAAMAFIGATSASALKPTQLCKVHTELNCPAGQAATLVHAVLLEGTVGKLLSSLVNVLCLTVLVEATPLALANPQEVHELVLVYEGCGTSSTHDNCTVTTEELPLDTVLKTGLDEGSLTLTNGRVRLQCPNLGIDCKYDTAGSLFKVGAGMITAEKTPTTELGGKFFCPDEGQVDGLLLNLAADPAYVLR